MEGVGDITRATLPICYSRMWAWHGPPTGKVKFQTTRVLVCMYFAMATSEVTDVYSSTWQVSVTRRAKKFGEQMEQAAQLYLCLLDRFKVKSLTKNIHFMGMPKNKVWKQVAEV